MLDGIIALGVLGLLVAVIAIHNIVDTRNMWRRLASGESVQSVDEATEM